MRGRDTQLDIVHRWVRAVGDGTGGALLIEGEAGAGKSRLVFDAAVAATTLGVSIATGGAGGDTERGSPAELEARAAHGPLLVALDDLSEAGDTLEALPRLMSALGALPVLWLLAGRGGAHHRSLGRSFAALEARGATRIELGPLPGAAVTAILADVTGAEAGADLLDLAAGAGGNPQLVVDLAQGLLEEGAVNVAGGVARLGGRQLPRRLVHTVARRVERLSEEARRLLDVGSLFGRSFSVGDVAEVLGQPVGHLLPALEESRAAGLLVPTGSALAFRDDLVRAALYEGLPRAIRLGLHRQIGTLLLDRGDSVVQASGHLATGARAGDRQVLAALDQAARELLASAPESAAEVGVRALELTSPGDRERVNRAVTAVNALMAAGSVAEATELARATLAAGGMPGSAAARLRLTLASVAVMEADSTHALAEAGAVLAQAGLGDDLYAGAEATRMTALMAEADYEQARRCAESVLAGEDRAPGDATLSAALTTVGSTAWTEGRMSDAIALLRAAVVRADHETEGGRYVHPRQSLAVVLAAIGDFGAAERLLDHDRREVKLAQDRPWEAANTIRRSSLNLARGRLRQATIDAAAGVGLAERLGTPLFAPLGWATLAAAALLGGDPAEAAEQVARCRAVSAHVAAPFSSSQCDWIEARIAYDREGPARAVELTASVYFDPSSYTRLLLEEPGAAPWLVRTALVAEAADKAGVVAAAIERLAADSDGITSVSAIAGHCRGLVDRDPAAVETAAADTRHPWPRASAQEDAGVLWAGADRRRARSQLTNALTSYQRMDAVRDADRVRARLVALGPLERSSRRAERPVEGWASLTDGERRVADLVAEGLTNPQIAARLSLSRHTVDFHLRHVFRKLNVTSRVELTRAAIRRDETSRLS